MTYCKKSISSNHSVVWQKSQDTGFRSEDLFCQFFWFCFAIVCFPLLLFWFSEHALWFCLSSSSGWNSFVCILLVFVGEFCWFSASAVSRAVPHVRNLTTSNNPWGSNPPPPNLQTWCSHDGFGRDSYCLKASLRAFNSWEGLGPPLPPHLQSDVRKMSFGSYSLN